MVLGAAKINILFLLLTFLSQKAHAADVKNSQDKDRSPLEEALIETNIDVSEAFDDVAEDIDLFLVGKKVTNKRNETSVRIENSTFSTEGNGVTNSTNLNVILRLPNLEKYWQLKFTTYDEQEESRGIRKGYLRQTPRQRSYGASVGLFRKLGKIRTSFRPRLELTNPLKLSHSLNFDTTADMKTYTVTPRLELFANADKGTGVFGTVSVAFKLSEEEILTFLNDAEYEDHMNKFSSTSSVTLGQSLSEDTSISYAFSVDSHSRPSYHLEGYGPSVSWSHILYRRILDYSITPQLNFKKDRHYKGEAGVNLNVSLNF